MLPLLLLLATSATALAQTLASPIQQPFGLVNTAIPEEPRYRILPSGEVQALEETPAQSAPAPATPAPAPAAAPAAAPAPAAPAPAPAPAAKAPEAAAAAAPIENCHADQEFSKIFQKCLPKAGKDGYTPSAPTAADATIAADDKKGKLMAANIINAEAVHQYPEFLRIAPLRTQPLAGQAAPQQPQQPPQTPQQPAQQPAQQPTQPLPRPQRFAAGQPLALRLACPPGFTLDQRLMSCIGLEPTGSPSALAERRGGSDDDDDDDGDDGDRALEAQRVSPMADRSREFFERRRRPFLRRRMFAPYSHAFPPFMRRGGGQFFHRRRFHDSDMPQINILAPIFVLPQNLPAGSRGSRIHIVHPSFVGKRERSDAAAAPIPMASGDLTKGKEATATAPTTAPVPETKPAPEAVKPAEPAKPEEPAKQAETPVGPIVEPKPKGAPQAPPAASETARAPAPAPSKPEALREAWISPAVAGEEEPLERGRLQADDVDAVAPLKHRDVRVAPLQAESRVAPLRVDAGVNAVPMSLRRAEFVNPLVEHTPRSNVGTAMPLRPAASNAAVDNAFIADM